MENLKWYVLNYDFNEKKVENFNIFRSARFVEGVQDLLEHYITFEDFVEKLESELRYAFWKVKPNVRILAKYIIDNYNDGLSC